MVNAYLSINELQVTRALRVAVTGTVLGTCLVVGELGHATIGVHLDEVEGTVETAREVGHVDVESELLVEEVEGLVGGVVLHQIDTRTNVGSSLERKGKGISGRRDAVGARVVCTVESAVLRASVAIGAQGRVPLVTRVAVLDICCR